MAPPSPQPTPDRPAAWRRHLATTVDAVYLPVLAAFVLLGLPILGVELYPTIVGCIVLTQAVCGGDPGAMAANWLRRGTTRPADQDPGPALRVFRWPPVRLSAAAVAIALIATHIGG